MTASIQPENIPALVAHRGYALRYPENTLESLRAALEAGACFIEFDVQLTADGVPVLLHDPDLRRIAGVAAPIHTIPLSGLSVFRASQTEKFGERFADVHIPTLAQAVDLLREWPRAAAFVEIKRASLRRFGVPFVVKQIIDALRPRLSQCVVISFDAGAVEHARMVGACEIGWVIDEWSARVKRQVQDLAPEYLFCDEALLPPEPEPLWPGSWLWAVYDLDDPERALRIAARGVQLIETMAFAEMLSHPILRRGPCARR